jgi:hypothetical protein
MTPGGMKFSKESQMMGSEEKAHPHPIKRVYGRQDRQICNQHKHKEKNMVIPRVCGKGRMSG